MQTNIGKWGASYAIRIPKSAADTLGLKEGQSVSISVDDSKLVLEKVEKKYDLAQMVEEMKSQTPPEYVWDDPPVGKELL